MRNNLFLVIAFLSTALMYGQDSNARNAVAKENDISSTTSEKINTADSNQNKKNAQSVKTTEVATQEVSGDLNDKKRNAVSEKSTKEGPK